MNSIYCIRFVSNSEICLRSSGRGNQAFVEIDFIRKTQRINRAASHINADWDFHCVHTMSILLKWTFNFPWEKCRKLLQFVICIWFSCAAKIGIDLKKRSFWLSFNRAYISSYTQVCIYVQLTGRYYLSNHNHNCNLLVELSKDKKKQINKRLCLNNFQFIVTTGKQK